MSQNQIISSGLPDKNSYQANMRKAPNQIKKKTLIRKKTNPELKNSSKIEIQLQQQLQQQTQQPIQQLIQQPIKMKSPPKSNAITSKNPINKSNPNLNIKVDLSWLKKYFIYRHESLNKYIESVDYKKTMERLPINYQKQINAFTQLKSGINKQSGNKNISPQNNEKERRVQINNLNSINQMNQNNMKPKRFIITGGYSDVVKSLTERGWVREKNVKSIEFDYIWTLKTNEINFMLLKDYQLCNHYFKNGQITRKSGLAKNIKNLYYKGIDPMNFYPRCYDLSIKTELADFKYDFKFTWAMSLLKLLQKEEQEISRISKTSKKFSAKVISTAISIVERNQIFIKPNVTLKELTNTDKKSYLISDEEWNTIYLPELTQTSNVKDIIFEVNSNKPGGINNPIKTNQNIPKNIINKPNETKNMLMSIQKAQTGVTGTNKMSPNLKSYAGLKSKINQLNNEEKKNNQKPSESINSSLNSTNKNKSITKIRDYAVFSDYKEKIDQILNNLKRYLPQYELNGFRNIWILKPSNLSRGRGVTCVDSLLPIEQSLSATNDTGLVVQKYIENPMIINQRKFDIRQWVLVTSLNPLIIWIWKEPYIRFGAEDYRIDDLNNIYSHLTNNSIAKHSSQYKNDTRFKEDMWTCDDFEKFLGKGKWKEIHEKMKNAIICSFYAAHHEIKQRENSHELYGYDFMIDVDFNVYLIEVNASPALDYSTKITEKEVKSMVKDLIEIVIDNNNGKNYKVNNNGEGNPNNKFIQIFNETKDKVTKNNVPNKDLLY